MSTYTSGYCAHCGQPFTEISHRHGGRPKTYCNNTCKFKALYQRRKARGRVPLAQRLGPRLPELELTCYCGADLIGFTFDRLTRTLEVCANGHETLCVARRRTA